MKEYITTVQEESKIFGFDGGFADMDRYQYIRINVTGVYTAGTKLRVTIDEVSTVVKVH